ncbi:unnamed protein product [Moneuplotes crassus]|uniref:Uncharacterized protein n=1 Tax=Euplotes crassus TaxID=5936 RepID=A0AAD1UML7_EUPCR|nr:unnamed protein product [Moneuplotes crassus]
MSLKSNSSKQETLKIINEHYLKNLPQYPITLNLQICIEKVRNLHLNIAKRSNLTRNYLWLFPILGSISCATGSDKARS